MFIIIEYILFNIYIELISKIEIKLMETVMTLLDLKLNQEICSW